MERAPEAQTASRETVLNPMLPELFRVQRIKKETHDTFTLALTSASGAVVPSFAAGQFNMLYAFGVGEVAVSISGDPADSMHLVHTIRAVGAVTRALTRLKAGNPVGVRGPYGTHWPVAEAEGNDVVIIAGGIGLAPLRPVLYHILARREKYGRVVLLYGSRTPADLLYRHELERWRSRFDLEVEVTVDRAIGSWHGNVGVVTTLIPKAPFDPVSTVAMVCGPEIMMRFVALSLQRQGVEFDRIYISMERNMKCAIGLCGHCQFGPTFVCKDGPVYRYDRIMQLLGKREI